jgi:NTE family protein
MIMPPPQHAPLRIGLALGSGGARGWAHIGVLRRLRELGISPQCIAGTSAGAIAAALYASDSLEAMEDLASHLDWKQVAQLFLEVNFPRSGILTGKNVMQLLKRVIAVRAISSLQIPYAAVATDLEAEKEVILQSGNLFDAIRASIGIPGIFTPTRLNGKLLVDGGLVNPLPVSVCRAMGADLVIAVDVNLRAAPKNRKPVKKPQPSDPPQRIAALLTSLSRLVPQRPVPAASTSHRWISPSKSEADPLSIFDVLTRSFRLVENQITRRELALNPPDILIQPEVGDIMTLEFHRGPEAIAAGIRAVDEVLPLLQPLLASQTRLANRNA